MSLERFSCSSLHLGAFASGSARLRLNVSLDQHFREGSKFHLNDRVARIYSTTVVRGTMADYTLKNFKHGRVDSDSILILN
jgi:hypothetical protein